MHTHISAPIEQPLAYRPAAAAKALGIARQTVHDLIRRKQIRSVMLGGARLIPRSEIDRILAGRPLTAEELATFDVTQDGAA